MVAPESTIGQVEVEVEVEVVVGLSVTADEISLALIEVEIGTRDSGTVLGIGSVIKLTRPLSQSAAPTHHKIL